MDNLHEHLVSSLQGCHSLLLQNYSGQPFIRVIPSECDQDLGFFPLVEVRLTQHEDTVTISVVTFKRELLESSETRNITDREEIAAVIRHILFDNKYRICKVNNFRAQSIQLLYASIFRVLRIREERKPIICQSFGQRRNLKYPL